MTSKVSLKENYQNYSVAACICETSTSNLDLFHILFKYIKYSILQHKNQQGFKKHWLWKLKEEYLMTTNIEDITLVYVSLQLYSIITSFEHLFDLKFIPGLKQNLNVQPIAKDTGEMAALFSGKYLTSSATVYLYKSQIGPKLISSCSILAVPS